MLFDQNCLKLTIWHLNLNLNLNLMIRIIDPCSAILLVGLFASVVPLKRGWYECVGQLRQGMAMSSVDPMTGAVHSESQVWNRKQVAWVDMDGFLWEDPWICCPDFHPAGWKCFLCGVWCEVWCQVDVPCVHLLCCRWIVWKMDFGRSCWRNLDPGSVLMARFSLFFGKLWSTLHPSSNSPQFDIFWIYLRFAILLRCASQCRRSGHYNHKWFLSSVFHGLGT